ncbi:hypothetical protein J3458_005461 [Metarhizium acridum]|uniref:uncharacterized protein n=1 Tax=Metarhizium acridum TaxID=92637 RepID=UPI001C6C8A7B|nr:hypothetical protein J3458_005461 [Metarhizium acridum]
MADETHQICQLVPRKCLTFVLIGYCHWSLKYAKGAKQPHTHLEDFNSQSCRAHAWYSARARLSPNLPSGLDTYTPSQEALSKSRSSELSIWPPWSRAYYGLLHALYAALWTSGSFTKFIRISTSNCSPSAKKYFNIRSNMIPMA